MDTHPDVAIYQRVRKLQHKAWVADRGSRYRLYACIAAGAFVAGFAVGWVAALLIA